MPNMSLKKNEMPHQAPDIRNKNFDEVALGYTEEQAIDEAKRCLNCKTKPCVGGCPVRINIPAFIEKVAAGEFEEAYNIITEASSLPAVCGRSLSPAAAFNRFAISPPIAQEGLLSLSQLEATPLSKTSTPRSTSNRWNLLRA